MRIGKMPQASCRRNGGRTLRKKRHGLMLRRQSPSLSRQNGCKRQHQRQLRPSRNAPPRVCQRNRRKASLSWQIRLHRRPLRCQLQPRVPLRRLSMNIAARWQRSALPTFNIWEWMRRPSAKNMSELTRTARRGTLRITTSRPHSPPHKRLSRFQHIIRSYCAATVAKVRGSPYLFGVDTRFGAQ